MPKHPPLDRLVNILPRQSGEAGPLMLARSESPVPEDKALPAMPPDDIECVEEKLPAKPVAKPGHARRPPKKTGTSPVPAQHPACGKPASIAADTNSAVLPASCQASHAVRLPARTGAKAARVHRAMAKARNVEVTLRCFVRPR